MLLHLFLLVVVAFLFVLKLHLTTKVAFDCTSTDRIQQPTPVGLGAVLAYVFPIPFEVSILFLYFPPSSPSLSLLNVVVVVFLTPSSDSRRFTSRTHAVEEEGLSQRRSPYVSGSIGINICQCYFFPLFDVFDCNKGYPLKNKVE